MSKARATSQFTGVILAGGRSSRMGKDKAQLPIANTTTMLEHMRKLLLTSGAEKTVVLGKPFEIDGIPDNAPLSGPVKAIADYLNSQKTGSKHIVVPVDMPGLKPELLSFLSVQDGWAQFTDQTFPFLATAKPELRITTDRLRSLLKEMNCERIPAPVCEGRQRDSSFINLNCPQDIGLWIRAQKLEGHTVVESEIGSWLNQ